MTSDQPDQKDLERLIRQGRLQTADERLQTYRRAAEETLRHRTHVDDVLGRLVMIKKLADGFGQENQRAVATDIYRVLMEAISANKEDIDDPNWELNNLMKSCVAGLGKCLTGERDDTATRFAILEALFSVYSYDAKCEPLGLIERIEPLILKHANKMERNHIYNRVSQLHSSLGSGRAERVIQFLFTLGVDVSLQYGDVDRALRMAYAAEDYYLVKMADIFASYGHADAIEPLMLEHGRFTCFAPLLIWLKKLYAERRDTVSSLEMAVKVFHIQPRLRGFKEIHKLAARLGRWESLQPELLIELKDQCCTDLLVKIFLEEGQIQAALEAVQSRQSFFHDYNLPFEVAKAVEQAQPRAALEIYKRYAEQSIMEGGRRNYHRACNFLERALTLSEHLGERQTWENYINQIKAENRTERSLLEEITKANL